jgi:predicted RNA-binding Zn-ribbon protein involved in translation (DUF1610 family)
MGPEHDQPAHNTFTKCARAKINAASENTNEGPACPICKTTLIRIERHTLLAHPHCPVCGFSSGAPSVLDKLQDFEGLAEIRAREEEEYRARLAKEEAEEQKRRAEIRQPKALKPEAQESRSADKGLVYRIIDWFFNLPPF